MAVLVERLKVNGSIARLAIKTLEHQGKLKRIAPGLVSLFLHQMEMSIG